VRFWCLRYDAAGFYGVVIVHKKVGKTVDQRAEASFRKCAIEIPDTELRQERQGEKIRPSRSASQPGEAFVSLLFLDFLLLESLIATFCVAPSRGSDA